MVLILEPWYGEISQITRDPRAAGWEQLSHFSVLWLRFGIVLGLYCCAKTLWPKATQKGKPLFHLTIIWSHSISGGNQGRSGDRNWSRGHIRTLACSLVACEICFLIAPRTTSPETAHHRVSWPMSTGQSDKIRFLNGGSCSEMSLACVRLTNSRQHRHYLLVVVLSALKIHEDDSGTRASAGL